MSFIPSVLTGNLMRMIDLTPYEWRSLAALPLVLTDEQVPIEHKKKLIRLGVASEKAGKLVATFEGRLMLREHTGSKNS
jgi:hypothetical protein